MRGLSGKQAPRMVDRLRHHSSRPMRADMDDGQQKARDAPPSSPRRQPAGSATYRNAAPFRHTLITIFDLHFTPSTRRCRKEALLGDRASGHCLSFSHMRCQRHAARQREFEMRRENYAILGHAADHTAPRRMTEAGVFAYLDFVIEAQKWSGNADAIAVSSSILTRFRPTTLISALLHDAGYHGQGPGNTIHEHYTICASSRHRIAIS